MREEVETGQMSCLEESEKFYTGFEVYNVNNYDVFRNPAQAKELLMEALEIQTLHNNPILMERKMVEKSKLCLLIELLHKKML
ncbi:hypothetical protein [Mesotoga sp.]|uniref:hypothetical protein n=1 Tax=Mesotoga sp. TaxID=2053577 RepID=UPI00345E5382